MLDLSQYLPAPFAAQMLADLGAEVVKLEPPAGDPLRQIGPRDRDGVSAFYKLVNAGKTVVRADLKAAAGLAAARQLIDRADILLESFRPGRLAKLGLDPGDLAARNPGLIHCTLTGFGQTGPYAERVGHDLNYMAFAGGLAGSGTEAAPVMAHPPTADYGSALQAVIACLGAVVRRARTGRGALLDVSLSETVLAWQAWGLTEAARAGPPLGRGAGLLGGGAACYQIYRTADHRFVSLGALEAKFWQAFCQTVGRPQWIARHDDPLPQRYLIAEVTALFGGRDLAHWATLLDSVDCCFHPVLELDELPGHPQIQARGLLRQSGPPDPLVEVLFPAWIDGRPPAPRQPLREASLERQLTEWRSGAEEYG